MKPEALPRCRRVRRRSEYLWVQRGGRREHVRYFTVMVGSAGGQEATAQGVVVPCRLGITVTKKVGGAVVRNRIKRRVREAFRRQQGSFGEGLAVVFVAKASAAAATYQEVYEDVQRAAARSRRRMERA